MEDDDSGADSLKNHVEGESKNLDVVLKSSPLPLSQNDLSSPVESTHHSCVDVDTSEKHLDVSPNDDCVVKEKKVNGDCESSNTSIEFENSVDVFSSDENLAKCSPNIVSESICKNFETDSVSAPVKDFTLDEVLDKYKTNSIIDAENFISERTDDTSNKCKDDLISVTDLCDDSLKSDCILENRKSELITEIIHENSVCNLKSDGAVDNFIDDAPRGTISTKGISIDSSSVDSKSLTGMDKDKSETLEAVQLLDSMERSGPISTAIEMPQNSELVNTTAEVPQDLESIDTKNVSQCSGSINTTTEVLHLAGPSAEVPQCFDPINSTVQVPQYSEPINSVVQVPQCSEPIDTKTETPEFSEPIDSTTETSECSEPIHKTAETPKCSEPMDITAETFECSEPMDTTAETPECSEPIHTTAMAPECSEPINSTAETPECSEPINSTAETPECSEPIHSTAETPECSEPIHPTAETLESSEPIHTTANTHGCSEPIYSTAETPECSDPIQTKAETPDCSEPMDTTAEMPDFSESMDTTSEAPQCSELIDTTAETPECPEPIHITLETLESSKPIDTTTETSQSSEPIQSRSEIPQCPESINTTVETPELSEPMDTTAEAPQCSEPMSTQVQIFQRSESIDTTAEMPQCSKPIEKTADIPQCSQPINITAVTPQCSELTNSTHHLEPINTITELPHCSQLIKPASEVLPNSPQVSNKSDEMVTNIEQNKNSNTSDSTDTTDQSNYSNSSEDSENLNILKSIGQKRKIAGDSDNPNNEEADKFPIQYKGFKKKLLSDSEQVKIDKRINLKGNPFNPAWKKDPKPSKTVNSANNKQSQSVDKGIEVDSSTLQPEYAQYLGLQPIVKFKCSNCGASSFQTMSALNTHQIECKKFGKVPSPPNMLPQVSDAKSTNIKLTRKVFLCSACGTYYENWNLFLHMREVHRRYICLYCLGMFSVAEKLAEHLSQKHKVTTQNFSAIDEFLKNCHPNYFLLCISCDNVFSETDNFYSHVCSEQTVSENVSSGNNNKGATDVSINPDVSSQKPPSPDIKNKIISNKNNASTKRAQTEWKRTANQKGSPNRKDYDEDFPCSAASFCHVDLGDSHANSNTTSSSERSAAEKSSEKEGQEHHAEDSKDITNIEKAEVKSSNAVTDSVDSTLPAPSTESPSLNEISHQTNPSTKEKVSLLEKRPVKKPRGVPIKKPVKKRKISTVSKVEKLLVKLKNSVPVDAEVEHKPEKRVEKAVDKPVEKEQETHKIINDSSVKGAETLSSSSEKPDNRQSLEKGMLKIKMQSSDLDSDGESDDSQKLSMVVDENNSVSDYDSRKLEEEGMSHQTSSSFDDEQGKSTTFEHNIKDESKEGLHDEIQLAGEDVAAMALTLDDKINNVKIQSVVKECVRTSCLSCNYCRHAVKIAVNGKQLALHLLSEHRYTPVKNETSDDVVRKLKSSLEDLKTLYFNTETYDSSDSSIHIPYDKDDNFDCFQCNYVTNSHRDLYAHKRKSHTKSLLLCIMCKINFYSYSELLCHLCPGAYNAELQFQNADISFRCCFCRLDTIPSAFRLMVHLRKCHHTCDICLEICLDQQKLSTHMWKHKLNHLCYRCGIAYASKPDITKHLFWKHGTESVLCKKCLQKKWPHVYHFCIPPTSFICEECNTSFSKAVALKVHKRIHAGDFSYACTQCDKRFISKKLLSRHENRHNNIVENTESASNKLGDSTNTNHKEEIINVTDIPNENKETSSDFMDTSKDSDIRDKCHRKHKKDKDKEKEKKSKQVVDVYDLPPLNLSSESDSSDDEERQKKNIIASEIKAETIQTEINVKSNIDCPSDDTTKTVDCSTNSEIKEREEATDNHVASSETENKVSEGNREENVDCNTSALSNLTESQNQEDIRMTDNFINKTNECDAVPSGTDVIDTSADPELNSNNQLLDNTASTSEAVNNDAVEGIWENFYKNNSQNKSLPYPLCAMKSEVAYGIIMGDHDYCQQYRNEPVINEDIPTSNIDLNLSDDKIESEDPIKPSTPVHLQDAPTTLISKLSKKKQKSPKKKPSKGNNSSSSSDSSSDSDSSSCSCGTNCSCSSSSSYSSSSTSSDSDSSSTEGRLKQERRRKRKERRVKPKEDAAAETSKGPPETEPEVAPPVEPEDPPIRESELETDETSTDEEFYDRQPQRIANQLLAEKRNQLLLLASVAPVNNGTSSPTQSQESSVVEPLPVPTPNPVRQRQRTRRREGKKKVIPKEKQLSTNEKILSSPLPQYPENTTSNPKQLKTLETKVLPPVPLTPTADIATGSGSETDSMRSSKRRRIPNKFYGYSSGEEEDTKPTPVKWRKQDVPAQSPKRMILPPPTPRIQLTVPKQVIRKHNPPKPKSESSSNDSDSSDEGSVQSHPNQSHQQETKADVYCYCRCPYDEVSEMIACDDENCKIEWFHFECVGILVPPRGQWFCPECRKRRGLPT